MGVGAAVIGASVLGAGASILSANSAADTQQQAAQQASNTQLQMFGQTQQNLAPFIQGGGQTFNRLQQMLSDPNGLTHPLSPMFSMSQGDLEQTPGYQFTLNQGLKAVNNANSAKGWGLSGAGLKGVADYATGLADQTYGEQFNRYQTGFNNYWGQNNNIYNMLSGQGTVGANAAAGLATNSTNVGNAVAGNIIGAGNAGAAASIATGNAISGAPSNAMANYMLMSGMYGGGGGGSPSGGALNYVSVSPNQLTGQY